MPMYHAVGVASVCCAVAGLLFAVVKMTRTAYVCFGLSVGLAVWSYLGA